MSRNRYDRKPSRRDEAEQRQRIYDALTNEEKLALIQTRRGNSRRETLRIDAQMTAENAVES